MDWNVARKHSFSFEPTLLYSDHIISFHRKKSLGGGSILDMGVYTIQFCQWVFEEVPKSIKANGKLNEEGIDLEFSAEFRYGANKIGKVKTSILEKLSNTAEIVGTKGRIVVG